MDTGLLITAVMLFLITILLWGFTLIEGNMCASPTRPYDPMVWLRDVANWGAPPRGGRIAVNISGENEPSSEVRIGRVISRRGEQDDEAPGVSMKLQVWMDAEVAEIREMVNSPERLAPGSLVPVQFVSTPQRGRFVTFVEQLSEADARRYLLRYRLEQGLIDDKSYPILATGQVKSVDVRHVRPTGRLRDGHVEVSISFNIPDGRTRTVTGFLRPREVAAVRHLRRAPATHDSEGQWALGPTWY